MIAKRIVYSDHARRRLKGRHITRQEVRWLLARGLREQTAGNPQQYWFRGYLGKHEAALLVIEDAHRYFIRTVMWVGDDE